jgi:pimeloyl-ACP methyl ester carboxylesterase
MVEELRRLLQATGRRPPYIVVGHSLGGTLMELYARTYPSEVAGVVLVDSRAAEFGVRCRERGLACGNVDLAGAPEPIRSELEATRETERQVLSAPLPGAMPAIVLAHGREENGPEHEALWRSSQENLAAMFPAGRLIVAEMSGHFIQLDEPHLVVEAVRSVIESLQ